MPYSFPSVQIVGGSFPQIVARKKGKVPQGLLDIIVNVHKSLVKLCMFMNTCMKEGFGPYYRVLEYKRLCFHSKPHLDGTLTEKRPRVLKGRENKKLRIKSFHLARRKFLSSESESNEQGSTEQS